MSEIDDMRNNAIGALLGEKAKATNEAAVKSKPVNITISNIQRGVFEVLTKNGVSRENPATVEAVAFFLDNVKRLIK